MAGGRPQAQYSQALRLLKIVEMLQHRQHLTIPDLMDEFDINRRTVQRDMAVLHEIYAIEEGERTGNNEKTFRLKPGARTETLKLTLTEMIGLYMGRNLFSFAEGTDLKDAMDSLYDKLQARLCARNATVRESLPKKIYCTTGFPKCYKAADDVLNHILTGLVDEKRVSLKYTVPGRRPFKDVIHPYTLVAHNNALYVICYSERAGARRRLALERMRDTSWRSLGTFAYPDDYDPRVELGDAFGIFSSGKAAKVRLLFTPELAPYAGSRAWHPSMQTSARRDGSLEVSMELSITEELLHWITGYGGSVRVLAPKSLREQVRERHRGGVKAAR